MRREGSLGRFDEECQCEVSGRSIWFKVVYRMQDGRREREEDLVNDGLRRKERGGGLALRLF
jgi:hypothetical protein